MIDGARAFRDGAAVIRSGGLGHYVWLPTAVSLIIVVSLTVFAWGAVPALAGRIASSLPDWLAFLNVVIEPLLYLIGALVALFTVGFLAALISSPFLGALSQRVEQATGLPRGEAATSWQAELKDALAREARKLGYHLPRLLGVAVLTLIPVINLAAPVLWLVFGGWSMAVQFADYPSENRGLAFAETLKRLRSARFTALGFGVCVSLGLALPLLSFLVVPVAVAGGTLLWHRLGEAGIRPTDG